MLPALRRLTVLPLWFQAQAPLKNLPDHAFTAKTSSSDPQVKFQLADSEFPTTSFYRANPVHPPMSGTSGLCPKGKHLI
ncbi:hypothetical protein ILYODFUR_029214 [Ilyodon furcidens]|uniref:Uncharacterized protein n=1 Tax=Ilyodon furcidens TaxID=33524 RepID=A0ABV0UN26_9TELE